jgi:phosphopantothenoylcysteine synthetase/decarboxylase
VTATMQQPLPVLYVVICGSPAARDVYDFLEHAQDAGWRVCAVTTPMGEKFVDTQRLETLTGHPVRSSYKNPDDPDVLPPADAFVVAPASFNTVNKIAHGVSDTLAVGLVCEGLGHGRPVIVAPWFNRALARNGAYRRSLQHLRDDGVRLVLTERTQPGAPLPDHDEPFPWKDVLAELHKIPLTTPGS